MRPEKADTEYALEAVELRKRYGDVVALDGATLYVRSGVLMALVGPNGAGKTTLIEGVLGLRRLDGGKSSSSEERLRASSPATWQRGWASCWRAPACSTSCPSWTT